MTEEKFTFFYKNIFSNWTICEFTVDGIKYSSTEQYMMAEKARFFGDKRVEALIMATTNCRQIKAYGREVKPFNEDKWNSVARDVVYKGCMQKFLQNDDYLNALKNTAGTTLVEASKTDRIWGIGLDEWSPKAKNRAQWEGLNWLGEVLTKVRDDILTLTHRTKDFGWSNAKVA